MDRRRKEFATHCALRQKPQRLCCDETQANRPLADIACAQLGGADRGEPCAVRPRVSEATRKVRACFSGCHGHGFAWPCFRFDQSTATQSRDRGTQFMTCSLLMTNDFSDRRLGTGPQSLPECGWGRRVAAPTEAGFPPIWGRRSADPSHTSLSSGRDCGPAPYSSSETTKRATHRARQEQPGPELAVIPLPYGWPVPCALTPPPCSAPRPQLRMSIWLNRDTPLCEPISSPA